MLDHSLNSYHIDVTGVAQPYSPAEPAHVLVMCEGTSHYNGNGGCHPNTQWVLLRETDTHSSTGSIALDTTSLAPSLEAISLSLWVWLATERTSERIFVDDTDGAESSSLVEVSITAAGLLWSQLCVVTASTTTATLVTED